MEGSDLPICKRELSLRCQGNEVERGIQLHPGDGLGFFLHELPGCTDEAVKHFKTIWELMHTRCNNFSSLKDSFSQVFRSCTEHTVLQLGITMQQLLLNMPREANFRPDTTSTSRQGRQRDVLPLPMPSVGAVVGLLKYCTKREDGSVVFNIELMKGVHKQQRAKLIKRACSQIWRFNCIAVLNGQFLGWKGPLFKTGIDITPSQRLAVNNVGDLCNYFTCDPLKDLGNPDFEKKVKQRGVDYTGEETSHALPVRLGEILPGLPDAGVTGALDAAATAGPEVQEWLGNPKMALLPEHRWPDPLPSASMNMKRSDWNEIAKALVDRNILVPIDYNDIFKVRGKPLLNGMFSVNKKGVPAPGENKVTRLIMNLVPANSIQRLMKTDLDTLASASHWAGCQLATAVHCCGPAMTKKVRSTPVLCLVNGEG